MRTDVLAFVLVALVRFSLATPSDNVAGPTVPMGGIGVVGDGKLEVNGSANSVVSKKDVTLAEKVDDLMKREFTKDVEEAEQDVGRTFNETAKNDKASMETVVVISHKSKKNATEGSVAPDGTILVEQKEGEEEQSKKTKSGVPQEKEQDVDRIVDSHDNEYVLSKSKELAGLTVDPLLIQDLTILISASASVGWIFEGLGQPVINGYLTAGSAVGPGGFMLIKEVVQVESLAQLGVHFLLFYLGLEFSVKKMRAVGGVALAGGLLEMFIFIAIAVVSASVTEASVKQSLFVGALVSLSSTSVVIKCLEANGTSESRHGQITIGTLILQDCTVGLMFALMPLLEEGDGSKLAGNQVDDTLWVILSILLKLVALVILATAIARLILPPFVNTLARSASWELFQVTLIGFCLLGAWCFGMLGLSHELGAFIAGAMLSASDQHEYTVKAIDGVRTMFTALFITSIGLVMSPRFLFEHLGVLAVGTGAVVVCKTAVIFGVVQAFKFDTGSSLMVAMSLAQISEFAFVLLSMAVDFRVIGQEMYLMLVGVAALSLLVTPGIIRLATSIVNGLESSVEPTIPVVVNGTDSFENGQEESQELIKDDDSFTIATKSASSFPMMPHVFRRVKNNCSTGTKKPG
ncbi:hypothetical protein BSKO_08362 [Bryopsis sp. KO-2023]|nr:hypothetical protein BSKO_08362 [Bryopsis sp. KO-2023]